MNKIGKRKRFRQTIFIGAAISNNELITQIIAAESPKEATDLFVGQNGFPPKEILGPFYKKKTQVIENTRVLKFSNQTKRAIYKDWLVDAFFLQEPENQAYLVFINRVDNKNLPKPKGTITVPVSDLRIVQNVEENIPQ
jgi:hypothetical protein